VVGQLDGDFLPGSLPHKFILVVTLIICFVVNKFLSHLSLSHSGVRGTAQQKSVLLLSSVSEQLLLQHIDN